MGAVWFSDPDNATSISNSEFGKFITALVASPAEVNSLNTPSKEITFLWGDVGGQMYCRNAQDGGYSIFKAMASLQLDFFIANGDMMYADGTCPQEGPTYKMNTTATLNQNFTWQNIPADFDSISNFSVDWTGPEVLSYYQAAEILSNTTGRKIDYVKLRHGRYCVRQCSRPPLICLCLRMSVINMWESNLMCI